MLEHKHNNTKTHIYTQQKRRTRWLWFCSHRLQLHLFSNSIEWVRKCFTLFPPCYKSRKWKLGEIKAVRNDKLTFYFQTPPESNDDHHWLWPVAKITDCFGCGWQRGGHCQGNRGTINIESHLFIFSPGRAIFPCEFNNETLVLVSSKVFRLMEFRFIQNLSTILPQEGWRSLERMWN